METKMITSFLPLGSEYVMVPFTEKGRTGENRFEDILRVTFWICYT